VTFFLYSLLFVVLAEMGDKTQLLAMAFAARFAPVTVLSAVLVATLLNHGLAVVAGRFLTTVIPLEVISLVAALSFVLFGLWTLRGDTLEGEDEAHGGYGPFLTVAIAFFIAELGDKTQLATISLAVRYPDPLAVLLGTTTGMVIADAIGIVVGIVLGKRLPETAIRILSAAVFIFFGLAGTAVVLRAWTSLAATTALLAGVAVVALGAAHVLVLRRHRAAPPPAVAVVSGLPQSAFVLLLAVGWVASLGWVSPLVGVDHWVAFALLGGVGWKMIHGVMRSRRVPFHLSPGLVVGALVVAVAAGGEAVYRGFPLTLALVPLSLLLLAAVTAIGSPILSRRRGNAGTLHLLARHRAAIASGLILMGAATTVVLGHLAAAP
jgi:putative Ca2+/H+ antiporter (TMEM165/GDT1 family)